MWQGEKRLPGSKEGPLVVQYTEKGSPLWNWAKNQKSKLLYNFKISLNVSYILYTQTSARIWADSHSICLCFHKCTTMMYATERLRWMQNEGNTKRAGAGRKETEKNKVKRKYGENGSIQKRIWMENGSIGSLL